MQEQIYLDYMATTPVDPRVIETMCLYLGPTASFGNPASTSHRFGISAKRVVETAREQVAALINADPKEIIWTSGATESDNLAIKGAAAFYQRKGKHIITMSTEHKAVLDTCGYLETQGYEVTYLDPDTNGLLDLQPLSDAIRDDTLLVSIMQVNNETGVIQDLARIADIVKSKGVLLHMDAAQSMGKLEIDVKKLPVDLISMCAHKIYGPKGIGALYIRQDPQVRLEALIHGGKHERGMRSGTLATHQIAGMGHSFEIAANSMHADREHAVALIQLLNESLQGVTLIHNGAQAPRVANCLNLIFPGIRSEALMMSAPNIAISSGSACNSATLKPSHVLSAMGVAPELADCAVRISVGRFTTAAQIQQAATDIVTAVSRLRDITGVA